MQAPGWPNVGALDPQFLHSHMTDYFKGFLGNWKMKMVVENSWNVKN